MSQEHESGENQAPEELEQQSFNWELAFGPGLAIGIALGVALDNLALGVALGLAMSPGLAMAMPKKNCSAKTK
ncbi:MAG: hypothetical protein AAF483_28810 [Planctomycetota bacterium]